MAKAESIFAKKKRPEGRTGDALAEIQERQQAAVERESEADKIQRSRAKADLKKARAFSCYIDPDLKAELQAIFRELPPAVLGGGQSQLVERALRAEVELLRETYNKGKPFS